MENSHADNTAPLPEEKPQKQDSFLKPEAEPLPPFDETADEIVPPLDEQQRKMVVEAQELFWQYGLRSVTMDEIATRLSVSKKTIYQYFEDKADLIFHCVKHHLEEEIGCISNAAVQAENALAEVMRIMQHNQRFMLSFHPSILYDLQKYYPKAWSLFLEQKEKRFSENVKANMQRGIQEGLYRPDIDPLVMAVLRMEEVQMGFNPTVFPQKEFHIPSVQIQLFKHFIFGIVTPKGYEIFAQYLKEQFPDF
ncbi:TetR/AcrR family transcriptional regulator [Hugenholtzia roseola]|uniref:TetR/AcrR family transcriptional regulator n=1 Tax=Hugenholtzia roseola TaxID=1002 RepID=UPI00041B355D|nr:TetR/AcrR family transcriptional regulator [Hugenholtzia roseola]